VNIYFCEKCGERVTSVDIEQNRATQTAESKIYCQKCSKDLAPAPATARKDSMRGIQPASPRSSARNIPAVRKDSAPGILAASPSGTKHQSAKAEAVPDAPRPVNWVMIGGVAVFVALIVVGIGIGFSRSGRRTNERPVASGEPGETLPGHSENPAPRQVVEPVNPVGAAADPKKSSRPETPGADEAFARLIRFEGLKPDDKAGRINLLEEYLKNNAESANAARANLMLMDLRKELEPVIPDVPRPPVERAPAPPEIATTVTPPPATKTTPPAKPPQPPTSVPAVKEPPPKPAIPPAPVETPELIKLAAVRNELAPLEREFHFSAALDALQRKLEDPSLADIRELMLKDKAELNEIIALRQRAVDAMRNLKDKPLTLKMGKLTVSGKPLDEPASGGLKIKANDGPEMTINIDDLDPSDIETYAPIATGAEKGDDLRRRGLLFLGIKDLVKAREYFKFAQSAGSDSASAYLKRLDDLETEELETHAKQEWAAAEALFNAKRMGEANSALKSFKVRFAKTKTFAQCEEQLNKRLKEVELVLRPPLEGLVGNYYKGRDFNEANHLLTRIDNKIDFVLGAGKSPAKEVPANDWGARWEGLLKVPSAGHYTMVLHIDDGARLWIDGNLVIDEWKESSNHRVAGAADLAEGLHEIKLEYFQATGPSVCKLGWAQKNGFSEAIISAEALWHPAAKDPAAKK
jgi:hypothetical protein